MARKVRIRFMKDSKGIPLREPIAYHDIVSAHLVMDGSWLMITGETWSECLPTWEMGSIREEDE